MRDYKKVELLPLYGIQSVSVEQFVADLMNGLDSAMQDSSYFDHGDVCFYLKKNKKGETWISGGNYEGK
jgi:hypothetical protein